VPSDGADPVPPRYGERSLAEVLPALLTALGVPRPGSAGVLAVPPVRAAGVLLVDGLGAGLLRRYAADAPFLASLPDAGPLTAGFPSSTSTSLTSLGTGAPPAAHGMVGITMRVGVGAHGLLLHTLQWTEHGVRPAVDLRDPLPPERIQPGRTALERAADAGVGVTVVSTRRFENSGLTRAALRGGTFRGVTALGDLAAEMVGALHEPGRRLCYGYHSDLDALGHEHGPGSMAWRMQLTAVDRLVSLVAEQLPPDSLLAVTGDHGMVTVDRRIDADTDRDLRRDVALVGGDPRSRLVYARPGAAAAVLATWREVLGDAAIVVSRDEALADGWFGPSATRYADRIGDVVVAARAGTAVIRSAAEPGLSKLPGQHGALSAEEQWVPLLIAHRP
jgi:Type I phosphodiesterase / nucleotide pyrophosphatase